MRALKHACGGFKFLHGLGPSGDGDVVPWDEQVLERSSGAD